MRHLLLMGKYIQRKNRQELVEHKLAEAQVKQRESLDRLQGLS